MAFAPDIIRQAAITLQARTNAHREVSPYSFAQTSYDFQGGLWLASIDTSHMQKRDRATFLRWLVSLDGPKGSFELPAIDYAGPYGIVTANPVIAAAALARAQTVSLTLKAAIRNLLNFTERADNVLWVKPDASVVADATTDPLGASTADKLVENTATAIHGLKQTVAVVAGQTYVQSVHVKAAERSFFNIAWADSHFPGTDLTYFNLNTGAVISSNAESAGIVDLGGGWFRVWARNTADVTGMPAWGQNLAISQDGTSLTYTGDGTSGLYVWGSQFEAGSALTPYQRHGVQGDVDVPAGDGFIADDQITISGHLHVITSAAARVGDVQDVTIWPRLRSDVAVDDPVEALAPYGTWALARNENGYAVARNLASTAALEIIEAL